MVEGAAGEDARCHPCLDVTIRTWHKYKVTWEVQGGLQAGKPYVLLCIKRPAHCDSVQRMECRGAGMEAERHSFPYTSRDKGQTDT